MYKITLLINANAGLPCGWSETYYSALTSVSGATTAAQGLIQARRQILCKDFSVVAARLTGDILAPPARTQLFVNPGTLPGALSPLEDYPNTAILYQMRGPNSRNISKDIRGFPDNFIESQVATGIALVPFGRTLLDTFLAYLVSSGLGWRVNGRFGDPGVAGFRSTSVTVSPGGFAAINGAVPAGWLTSPPTIQVRGFKTPISNFNGTYGSKSYAATGGTILIPQSLGTIDAQPYANGGGVTVSQQTPAFIAPNAATLVRVSSRKTGRPFGLLRGRRPNR